MVKKKKLSITHNIIMASEVVIIHEENPFFNPYDFTKL